MKYYRTNFNYETELFLKGVEVLTPKQQKQNLEFDYLFLWMESNECTLVSPSSFSEDYLDYIQKLKGDIPAICSSHQGEVLNWWGELLNLELERKLNSKLTSKDIYAKFNDNDQLNEVILEYCQLELILKENKQIQFLLKDPYSFSGMNSFVINYIDMKKNNIVTSIERKLRQGPLLLEKNYSRIMDLGITFIIENGKICHSFIVNNFIGPTRHFKGGMDLQAGINYQTSINEGLLIAEEYIKLGAINAIQLDSFFYIENGEIKYRSLVEANYRKTMGLFIHSLNKMIPRNGVGIWRIFSNIQASPFKKISDYAKVLGCDFYNQKSKVGILPISPCDRKFITFFITDMTALAVQMKVLRLIDLLH